MAVDYSDRVISPCSAVLMTPDRRWRWVVVVVVVGVVVVGAVFCRLCHCLRLRKLDFERKLSFTSPPSPTGFQGSHPIHKVTIVPRGHSLGHTAFVPSSESNRTKAQLKAHLDVAMGGRIGELVLDREQRCVDD